MALTGLKSRCQKAFLKVLGKNVLLCLLQLLETACVLWLMAPFLTQTKQWQVECSPDTTLNFASEVLSPSLTLAFVTPYPTVIILNPQDNPG